MQAFEKAIAAMTAAVATHLGQDATFYRVERSGRIVETETLSDGTALRVVLTDAPAAALADNGTRIRAVGQAADITIDAANLAKLDRPPEKGDQFHVVTFGGVIKKFTVNTTPASNGVGGVVVSVSETT